MNINILTLDKMYQPHRWINVEEAMVLESKNLVIDRLGKEIKRYTGGTNAKSGERSFLETSSIIVVDGAPKSRKHKDPALTNMALFQRDRFLCGYCAGQYRASDLTRDHIHPTSKGGRDTWMNVVTSCKGCNALKGDLMPGQKLPGWKDGNIGPQGTGKMDPLYVPYVPCRAEHMILKNRSIKADQMEFLLGLVTNKKSRIFDYAKDLMDRRDSR